jgi:hypothetical protein
VRTDRHWLRSRLGTTWNAGTYDNAPEFGALCHASGPALCDAPAPCPVAGPIGSKHSGHFVQQRRCRKRFKRFGRQLKWRSQRKALVICIVGAHIGVPWSLVYLFFNLR